LKKRSDAIAPHELAEKTTGLASRANNLAILYTGDESRTFLEQQDDLTKLALAAIVKDLNAERPAYKAALQGLNDAIQYVGDADQKLTDVAKGIALIAKAISLVEKALKAL
jgi:ABC-type transporter Mla subunit MlaD